MPETYLPVYVLCLLTLSSASYIQNTPWRGKRAFPDTEIRQCITCGPEEEGNCFGPSICCGEEFGCLIETPETLHCLEENNLPDPCMSGWKFCSEGGRCAVSGICCGVESCYEDAECVHPE